MYEILASTANKLQHTANMTMRIICGNCFGQSATIIHCMQVTCSISTLYHNILHSKHSAGGPAIPQQEIPFCQYCSMKLVSNFGTNETISDSKSHAP